MAPLPKRKYSKARRGERRSHLHWASPAAESCPRCHSLKLAHTVCPTCGHYRGREVIRVKSAKKRA